jgi:hypothetical protein
MEQKMRGAEAEKQKENKENRTEIPTENKGVKNKRIQRVKERQFMTKKYSKIVWCVLSMCMALSMLCTAAFAEETEYASNNDGTHTAKTTDAVAEKCTYEDGVCKLCGYKCTHTSVKYTATEDGSAHTITCTICNYDYDTKHQFSGNTCKVCGYVCEHKYENGSSICTVCGDGCTHEGEKGYIPNDDDNTHIVVCKLCKTTIDASAECEVDTKTKTCTLCGKEVEKVSASTNTSIFVLLTNLVMYGGALGMTVYIIRLLRDLFK